VEVQLMTEAEWLARDAPFPMIEFLGELASERKRRLFCCACCRCLWPSELSVGGMPNLLAFNEARADGLLDASEVAEAWNVKGTNLEAWAERLDSAHQVQPHEPRPYRAVFAAAWAIADDVSTAVDGLICVANSDEEAVQASIVRDIFGNPFRSVPFSPDWRTDTTVSLARQMYEARDFSAMPILADALQDAGCEDEAILNHCRNNGQHVRGCWVVDLSLGRE
jgi:hypothetical protein